MFTDSRNLCDHVLHVAPVDRLERNRKFQREACNCCSVARMFVYASRSRVP
jgi:hypothetical protein